MANKTVEQQSKQLPGIDEVTKKMIGNQARMMQRNCFAEALLSGLLGNIQPGIDPAHQIHKVFELADLAQARSEKELAPTTVEAVRHLSSTAVKIVNLYDDWAGEEPKALKELDPEGKLAAMVEDLKQAVIQLRPRMKEETTV